VTAVARVTSSLVAVVQLVLEHDTTVHSTGSGREITVEWVRLAYHLNDTGTGIRWIAAELSGYPDDSAQWAKRRRHPRASIRRSFEVDRLTAPSWLLELATEYAPSIAGHKLII
jgi:hypothetical protein